MRRSIKTYVMLMMLLLCSMLISCGKDKTGGDLTPIPTIEGQSTSGAPELSIALPQTMNITYYTLSDSMENKEATWVLAKDTVLTPEELVRYVISTMEDVSVEVEVLEVCQEGQKLIIDFDGDTMPVKDTAVDLEEAILDAIAQSVLENFEDISSVVYRVNGGAYRSDNRSYDINYIYLGK